MQYGPAIICMQFIISVGCLIFYVILILQWKQINIFSLLSIKTPIFQRQLHTQTKITNTIRLMTKSLIKLFENIMIPYTICDLWEK